MIHQSSGDNPFVKAIIERYLKVQDISPDKLDSLADELVQLVLQAFDDELRSTDAFNLPYKDITDSVFDSEKQILTGSLTTFGKNMEKAINHSFDEDSPNKHHEKREKYVRRFMYIHGKFVEHILLAQVQKEYIERISNKAEIAAESAYEIAEEAKKTYNTMFANYVTILGVFTAIIVTIFGGLNVLGSVVLSKNADFSVILSLAALALLCMVSLLYFLTHMILKIINKGDGSSSSSKHHLTWTFIIIAIVCVMAALLGIEMTAIPK